MKKIIICFIIILSFIFAFPVHANTVKKITGKVTNVYSNQIVFTTPNAAYYSADTLNVTLIRRYGSPMSILEMKVGDKVEVTGTVWPDNKVTASLIKDVSLYTHTGTISGKIVNLDPLGKKFTVINSQRKTFTIQTNSATSITKNNGYATLTDLSPGMTVSVKGTWERDSQNIDATIVKATFRLVNIYVTGSLVMKGPGVMTIVASNNTIYGIDIGSAELQSKNGKSLNLGEFNMTDKIKVWGKHISGVAQITASLVKDNAIIK